MQKLWQGEEKTKRGREKARKIDKERKKRGKIG
jgi:hypothetical protein